MPQANVQSYSTVVHVPDSGIRVSAAVSYPDLDCRGTWTPTSSTPEPAELEGTVTVGAGRYCLAWASP